jgi:predicted SAM-dependent methyltransferase
MHWRIERLRNTILKYSQKLIAIEAENIKRYLWHVREKNFPKTSDGKILLHIGCGEINAPEFINIDARKFSHIHIVTRNIFRLWIPSNTADLIYMCHILEHVPRNKLSVVLKEMLRILKPNGKLRLSVPDFNHLISIYNDTSQMIESISPPLMGGQAFPENFHFEVFNKRYLEKLLMNNGFINITEWDPLKVEYHNFEDWASKPYIFNNKAYQISLNLEASKAS